MGAAGPAGLPGVAEEITAPDVLAGVHGHRSEVEVLGLEPAVALDDHVVRLPRHRRIATALGAVTARESHDAVERRHHRGALRHPEIPGPAVVADVASDVVHLAHRERHAATERDADLGRLEWNRDAGRSD